MLLERAFRTSQAAASEITRRLDHHRDLASDLPAKPPDERSPDVGRPIRSNDVVRLVSLIPFIFSYSLDTRLMSFGLTSFA